MAGFPALNTIQPIIGCDMHLTIPPPPPAPPPHTPHVVVWVVGLSQKINFIGLGVSTSKACSPESAVPEPVLAGWGYACGRTHDSGPHPGHIWPNLLLPLIMLGSSSKHEFGAGTVQTPKGDMAVGVAWVVDLGLDCFDFPYPPLPSGLAITAANTVRANFTLADFGRGLVQMFVDGAIAWLIGLAFFGMGKGIDRLAPSLARSSGSFFGSNAPGFFARNGRLFVDSIKALWPAAKNSLKSPIFYRDIAEAGAKWMLGGPTGSAAPFAPYSDLGGKAIDDGINDLWR